MQRKIKNRLSLTNPDYGGEISLVEVLLSSVKAASQNSHEMNSYLFAN